MVRGLRSECKCGDERCRCRELNIAQPEGWRASIVHVELEHALQVDRGEGGAKGGKQLRDHSDGWTAGAGVERAAEHL